MSNEYPRDEELKRIADWDLLVRPVQELLDYVESLWKWEDWGFKLKGKRVLRLELHTGGWSGNEDIVGALQENFIFWSMCWVQSRRGGHYKFIIPLRLFREPEAAKGEVNGSSS